MNFKNTRQYGFSLMEALLAMVILGVIFAAAVSNFKSLNVSADALNILKENTYAELDRALIKVVFECTDKSKQPYELYKDCNKSSGKYTSTEINNGTALKGTVSKYLRGTVGVCDAITGYSQASSLRLRNGTCIYFPSYTQIFVDVNGATGPNDGSDRMTITLNNLKITSH